ncbi:hypothetical protein [Caulobacter sp. S45]|uniref:hypothetical protein n=1 Tax=Caulobacter sp. S45 TaxID=1641861 RepID=UPI0015772542|nr:hypothetical protein [Caulobacter sp. S45]
MADSVVFLTLHKTTAARLRDCIQDLLAEPIGASNPGHAVRMVGEDIDGPADFRGLGPGSIIVTSLGPDAWAAHAEASGQRLRAVYVRPELMLLHRGVGALWPEDSDQSRAWSQLLALDLRLSVLPQLLAEDVHGRSTRLWQVLADQLGLPESRAQKEVEGCDAGGSPADLVPPIALCMEPDQVEPWIPSGILPTCAGGAGLWLLDGGWSAPEPQFVWSHGPRAGLRLPCSPAVPTRWRLEGSLIGHPQRTVRVEIWDADILIGAIENTTRHGLDFSLDLGLPPAPGGVRDLRLQVDKPVSPRKLGAGDDGRALGVALRSLQRGDLAGPTALSSLDCVRARRSVGPAVRPASEGWLETLRPAFLSDPLVVEAISARPHLALVLASDPSIGEQAARACRQYGCEEARVLDGASMLASVSAELSSTGGRVGVVVLCDAAQHQPWFHACGEESAVFGEASIILPTGDPYGCPRELFWHSQTWDALLQFSEVATVSSSRPHP